MRHAFPRLLAGVAALVVASSAAAQNFGPQPGYQPGPALPNVAPSGSPSIVGTWSGQNTGPNGTIQQATAYGPDGRFMSVGRLPNGFLARIWGSYRTTSVSSNQLRLQTQAEGWLPRETCRQMAGGPPQCQPMQIPTSNTFLITFSSPNQFQAMSEVTASGLLTAMRDNQPALLQAQAPQRWLTVVQPAASPGPAPAVAPYASPARRSPAITTPGIGGNCDDLQQRRMCSISGGHLVSSGGCLTCVN